MQNPPVPAHLLEMGGWFRTFISGCTSFVGWADLKNGSHLWNRDINQKYAKEDKVRQEQAETEPGVWKPVQTKWDFGFVHGDPWGKRTVVLDEGTLPLA